MATSGASYFGGSSGSNYTLYVNVQLLSQDYANNRSLVRLNAYVHKNTGSGYYYYGNIDNNGYFNSGAANIDADWGSGYDFRSYTDKYILQNYDGWVTHNSDGTKTATFGAYSNMAQGVITTATVTFNYTLPTIPQEPTVTTGTVSNVLPTEATVGGNVTSQGGASITQRGFYYSTSDSTPDSDDSVQLVSGTTGSYSATLTGLTANTFYYVRAFAKNSKGTGYGSVKTFTTSVTPYASLTYSNSNPYADGKLIRDTGGGWADVTSGDLYFETRSEQGATTVDQNSQDPSDIIRDALDYAETQGTLITYDGTSLEDTSTSVSYSFVSQSVNDVINTVLGLSPNNWYWYIDTATNKLEFHQKSSTADHILTLGKDVAIAEIDKRADDIVNRIFFTGGDQGGGSILYKKYQDPTSIGVYGVRDDKYIDQRVTTTATADLIASNILSRKAYPEVRLRATVSDNNSDRGGYNIESIKVGDVIALRNVKASSPDVVDLDQVILQVVRREYSPSTLNIICSTVPPEVTKRIEDIKRNLDDSITINNPDTPS